MSICIRQLGNRSFTMQTCGINIKGFEVKSFFHDVKVLRCVHIDRDRGKNGLYIVWRCSYCTKTPMPLVTGTDRNYRSRPLLM